MWVTMAVFEDCVTPLRAILGVSERKGDKLSSPRKQRGKARQAWPGETKSEFKRGNNKGDAAIGRGHSLKCVSERVVSSHQCDPRVRAFRLL